MDKIVFRVVMQRPAIFRHILFIIVPLAFCFYPLIAKAQYVTPWSILINTNNVVNVTNYAAVADGVTTNTTAIQDAINAATGGGQTNGLIGGTVEIPGPGVYLCGPLTLAKNVNLQVDAGAILRMLPYASYPGGIVSPPNFISASGVTNIEISGSGAIDGQGGPWWPGYETNNRPIMIYFSDCKEELVQNITLSNSPEFHIYINGSSSLNTTIQNVTVLAPSSTANPASHNTDADDVAGKNILIQNCSISTGDDDFAASGGTSGILVTNNTYGNGHGISIGSYTDSGGVSNMMVINCTMNGTVNGIRIKSDNNRGGLVQNINYCNIGMTNVEIPIQVYAYYNETGTPNNVTPATAATEPVASVSSLTPIYRNIIFSNITATAVSGNPAIILWPRTELPGTNIVFDDVNITAYEPVEIYNASGVQFIDSQFAMPPGVSTYELFDAQIIVSNSAPTGTLQTIAGLTTNGYANTLALFNGNASFQNTNVFANSPFTLGSGTLTVSNNLSLSSTVLNYYLGTNPTTISVVSNLFLGGTININGGAGFTNGVYPLLTYGKSLTGNLPVLGQTPGGYDYTLASNIIGQVDLDVTLLPPTNLVATATNLEIDLAWNPVIGANTYNLYRGTSNNGPYPTVINGLTTTSYADTNVTNGVTYYYVVTAVGAGGESSTSLQASAIPLPSNVPANVTVQASNNQLLLSWPQDHLGWVLQMQTNGLGNNWVDVPNSANVTSTNIPIDPTQGSVFLRLAYP